MSLGNVAASRALREGWHGSLMGIQLLVASSLRGQVVDIGEPVPISPQGAGAYSWTTIASSPVDNTELIACGFRYSPVRGGYDGVLYYSGDGGASWHVAIVDSSDDWVSEETCAYGPDGEAYFIAQPHSTDKPSPYTDRWKRWVMRLYRSGDGGRTWATPTLHPMLDATQIAVDDTRSPRRGAIYIFGNSGPLRDSDGNVRTEMRFVLSNDGGRTTSSPLSPEPSPTFRYFPTFPGGVRVLSNGSVVAVYLTGRVARSSPGGGVDWPHDQYIEVVSLPGGRNHLTTPVVVHNLNRACMGTWPAMAVDRSRRFSPERLYVLYSDIVAGSCRTFLSWSDDGATQWRAPAEVSPVAMHAQSAMPAKWRYASLAVSPQGIIGITWADDDAECWYVTGSVDGGRTFAAARALNDCQHADRSDRASFAPYLQAWDFADSAHVGLRVLLADEPTGFVGLTADLEGIFHALWVEGLNGGGRLWTTAIAIGDRGERRIANRSPTVPQQPLSDVSSSIELRYSNVGYDPVDHVCTLQVSVRNVGNLTVVGSLYLQVDTLESALGTAVPVDADRRFADSTVAWDLSQLIPPAGLQSGMVSPSRRIAIRILNYHPVSDRYRLRAFPPFIIRMIGRTRGALAGATER